MSALPRIERIDDCWNRIGIRGDASCPELKAHFHCRNCNVYSTTARGLLDRPPPADHLAQCTTHFASPRAERERHTESALLFRTGAEWLALATAQCQEVASARAIHTLPHRRHAAVLGLVNVRGELLVCVSLAGLLGLRSAGDSATRRVLIVNGEPGPTALQVDEVHGTHPYNARDLAQHTRPPAGSPIHAILRWRDRTVGVLDEAALLGSLARCLA